MVPFIKLRSLPSCCQHHRQSTSNAFINTKKAFKKLSMFYFETFRIIFNPSSFWSLLILKLSLFLSLLVVRRFDDDAVQLVFLCRRMWLSPPKPRGDGTCYQQTSISKTVSPNHASWDIDLLDAQQWLQRLSFYSYGDEQLYSVQPASHCQVVQPLRLALFSSKALTTIISKHIV